MPVIEWSDSFSVHDPEMDTQHQRWIEIYNTMHDRLIEGSPASVRTLARESLEAMRNYTLMHFMLEEEHMADIGYPEIAAHAAIHRAFAALLDDHILRIEKGELLLNTTLISLVRDWLLDHILEEDQKYARFSRG